MDKKEVDRTTRGVMGILQRRHPAAMRKPGELKRIADLLRQHVIPAVITRNLERAAAAREVRDAQLALEDRRGPYIGLSGAGTYLNELSPEQAWNLLNRMNSGELTPGPEWGDSESVFQMLEALARLWKPVQDSERVKKFRSDMKALPAPSFVMNQPRDPRHPLAFGQKAATRSISFALPENDDRALASEESKNLLRLEPEEHGLLTRTQRIVESLRTSLARDTATLEYYSSLLEECARISKEKPVKLKYVLSKRIYPWSPPDAYLTELGKRGMVQSGRIWPPRTKEQKEVAVKVGIRQAALEETVWAFQNPDIGSYVLADTFNPEPTEPQEELAPTFLGAAVQAAGG